jgi:hypothetical protein
LNAVLTHPSATLVAETGGALPAAQEAVERTMPFAVIRVRAVSSAQTRSRHKVYDEPNAWRYWMAWVEGGEVSNLMAPVRRIAGR